MKDQTNSRALLNLRRIMDVVLSLSVQDLVRKSACCAGLFTALMLHFDARNGSGKHYFYSAMVGYSGGLASTILVMNYFKAAQPALLYIVPAVCLAVFAQAAVRGEIKALLAFSDEGSDPIPSPKKTPAEGQSSAVDADEVPAELRTFDAGQTAPGFQVVGELKKSK